MSKKDTSRVITPVFRVSFPHVFEAQPSMTPGGKSKFGVMALFSPKEFTDGERALWDAMKRIANEASIAKFKKALNELPPNFKRPWHRGDEKAEYGFTAEQIYTNITSHMRPGIVAADGKTPILTLDQMPTIYPGCYARASVNAYGYDNSGKGVAFGLNNLMFVRDGERLDNKVDAAVEFGDMGEAIPASVGMDDDFLGI